MRSSQTSKKVSKTGPDFYDFSYHFWNHFGDHSEGKNCPKSAPKMEMKMDTENLVVLGPRSGLAPPGKGPGRVVFLKMQVLGV